MCVCERGEGGDLFLFSLPYSHSDLSSDPLKCGDHKLLICELMLKKMHSLFFNYSESSAVDDTWLLIYQYNIVLYIISQRGPVVSVVCILIKILVTSKRVCIRVSLF